MIRLKFINDSCIVWVAHMSPHCGSATLSVDLEK